jgi:hypothetical protein
LKRGRRKRIWSRKIEQGSTQVEEAEVREALWNPVGNGRLKGIICKVIVTNSLLISHDCHSLTLFSIMYLMSK